MAFVSKSNKKYFLDPKDNLSNLGPGAYNVES